MFSKAYITNSGESYQILLASEITDSEIHDGSVALGKVYCCWEPDERENSIAFYIPENLMVKLGDIVEVKAGMIPARGNQGSTNTATRVVQKAEVKNGQCHWVPEDEHLWGRVLYCDWMPTEGWIEQKGLWKTWLKMPEEGKLP